MNCSTDISLLRLRELISSEFCLGFIVIIVSTIFYPTFALATDITGTGKDDSISGTMGHDKILGKDGKDSLYGLGGDDTIHGDSGDDFVVGDSGKDILEGNDGNDVVQGGSGSDKIDGGNGNDTLIASFALDSSSIRDYAPDTIICGPGFDTAFINPSDGDTASSDCEVIIASP